MVLACSLHFLYGVNLCETRLCGSLTHPVGLILNWSGWNMDNEKDWWALSRFELTDVWRLAGVIGLLYGWSFTSGQEMHSACFQWSEGDWLTNCSLLESLTLLPGSPNWFDGMLWQTDATFLSNFFDLARRFWNQYWKKKETCCKYNCENEYHKNSDLP